MQNKISLLLFSSAIIALGACSSSKKTSSENKSGGATWQTSTVKINGSPGEWDLSSMDYERDSKVAYKITNDADNIYVLLLTKDEASQMKILAGGMSLFVDPAGKKKEASAINFPVRTVEEGTPGKMPPGGSGDRQRMKAQAISNANQYTLAGFKTGDGGYSLLQRNAAKVEVKLGYNTADEMVYEAMIPFSALYNGDNVADAGSRISVGFKIKGLPKPDMDDMPAGGMGGGRSPGGGRPGGGGSQADTQKLFSDVKIWKTVSLAKR